MSLSWLTRKKRFTVANTVMRSIQETEINKSCTAKRPGTTFGFGRFLLSFLCSFCFFRTEAHNQPADEGRKRCADQHRANTGCIDKPAAKQGAHYISCGDGHRHICLSFNRILRLHDAVHVIDAGDVDQRPAEHLERLNSVVCRNIKGQEGSYAFQDKKTVRRDGTRKHCSSFSADSRTETSLAARKLQRWSSHFPSHRCHHLLPLQSDN